MGPKRLIAPALTVEQLPKIDLVLLSHAHFDHFDMPTLKALPAGSKAVTAKNTGDLLAGTSLKGATELAWGEKASIKTAHGEVDVEAFEVKHWGARWRRDTYRGYNGYMLSREGKKIIFGGDTANTDSFRPLRSKGPFEVAIMPIGSYKPFEIFALHAGAGGTDDERRGRAVSFTDPSQDVHAGARGTERTSATSRGGVGAGTDCAAGCGGDFFAGELSANGSRRICGGGDR